MSLHADLLKQANFLAKKEPKKPIQASLRRSISASYYSLFHLLVDEATRLMLPGSRSDMRDCLARAFKHSDMKQTAKEFKRLGRIPPRLANGSNEHRIQPHLIEVADAFIQLQEARHEADYNRAYRFTRREALDLADLTDRAFQDWKNVRSTPDADAFLVGLLAYRHIQG